MAEKFGTTKMSAPQGATGSTLLTETHTKASTGISSSAGATGYEVQVFKVAWGASGEFHWADDSVNGNLAGPVPVQMLDSTGTPFNGSAIDGSSNKMLDINIRAQTGTGSALIIRNPDAGKGSTNGGYIAIAGTTNGGHVPVAGSIAGGAIPHIGATTDILGSFTSGDDTAAHASGATGNFSGTVSAKLRTIASDIHALIAGGTGADGTSRTNGLNVDIRTVTSGITLATQETQLGGFTFTNSIQAIAGGVTIGIGSVSVDNPVVIAQRGVGATFAQLNSVSTTLVSGVRVKNVNGSGTLTVTYDALMGSTTGMTGGFQLTDREEIFVEVDDISKVYIKSAATAGCTLSYYAT